MLILTLESEHIFWNIHMYLSAYAIMYNKVDQP